MTQAVAALGTKLLKGDGASPENFTAVAEVKSLKGPSESMDTIDVTNLDSAGSKEFIQGLHDAGEVSFTVNWNPSHESLRTFGPVSNWKIQLPSTGTPPTPLGHLEFAGVVTKFDRDFDESKQLTVDITIKVSGQVTFVAGS